MSYKESKEYEKKECFKQVIDLINKLDHGQLAVVREICWKKQWELEKIERENFESFKK